VDWPLIGREGFLREAEGWLENRSGGALIIAGPGGIGKTRLLDKIVLRAGALGYRVLTAAGTLCTRPIPLGALAHLLRDVDTPNRLDLLVAAARQLQARTGTLMLAVDDAYLLDDWSAALMHHLVAGGSARVAIAVRDPSADTTSDTTSVPDAIAALGKVEHARWLRLPPLTAPEVAVCLRRALAPSGTGATEAVVDERTVALVTSVSGGNPLLVRELIREALRTGDLSPANGVWRLRRTVFPSTLHEQLERRLSRLDRRAYQAVELIALGEPLELQPLEAIVGAPALEAAEREGLIHIVESGRRRSVRLTHPMLGEAVRSRIPALARRRVCRSLTAMLTALPRKRSEDPLRLASWHLTSGEPLPADALLAGAELAARRHDHELAGRLAEAAVQAGAGFAARLLAAESQAWRGRLEDAEAALACLEREAVTTHDRGWVARARSTVLAVGLGRLDDARAVLDRACAGPLLVPHIQVLEGVRIVVDLATGDTRRALASADQVIRPDGDPVTRLHLLPALVTALSWTGHTGEAARVGTSVLEQVSSGLPYLTETAQATVAFARTYGGEPRAAMALAREGYRRASQWQADDLRGVWGYVLGYAQLCAGVAEVAAAQLAETSALLRERLTLFGVRGLANCLGALAEAYAISGQVTAAEWALRGCDTLPTSGHFLPHVQLGRAWTSAARGDLEAARDVALDLAHESAAMGCPTYAALAAHTVVRLGGATAVANLLAGLTSEASIVRAYADHARGVSATDGALLDDVAGRFTSAGALLLAAEASAHAFSAHHTNGSRRAAQAATARCRELARQCGPADTPPLRLVHERTLLTTREREVAALVVSGMRSRDVAQRLGVSPRTVENHLSRLYTKLGISSRDELMALFRSFPPSS
jgi:DNA-binding CsgD family transcriptional regulator